jgi:hypothetical protein
VAAMLRKMLKPVTEEASLRLVVLNNSDVFWFRVNWRIPFFVLYENEKSPYIVKRHSPMMISLDRDFYIRGRHEGADNSLCKS